MRFILRARTLSKVEVCLKRRFCEADLLERKCRPKEDLWVTLPVGVTLNRFSTDFLVFCLNILFLNWCKCSYKLLAHPLARLVDSRNISKSCHYSIHGLTTEFPVRQLAADKFYSDAHFIAIYQKFSGMPNAGVKVVLGDKRSQTDFF